MIYTEGEVALAASFIDLQVMLTRWHTPMDWRRNTVSLVLNSETVSCHSTLCKHSSQHRKATISHNSPQVILDQSRVQSSSPVLSTALNAECSGSSCYQSSGLLWEWLHMHECREYLRPTFQKLREGGSQGVPKVRRAS